MERGLGGGGRTPPPPRVYGRSNTSLAGGRQAPGLIAEPTNPDSGTSSRDATQWTLHQNGDRLLTRNPP